MHARIGGVSPARARLHDTHTRSRTHTHTHTLTHTQAIWAGERNLDVVGAQMDLVSEWVVSEWEEELYGVFTHTSKSKQQLHFVSFLVGL